MEEINKTQLYKNCSEDDFFCKLQRSASLSSPGCPGILEGRPSAVGGNVVPVVGLGVATRFHIVGLGRCHSALGNMGRRLDQGGGGRRSNRAA